MRLITSARRTMRAMGTRNEETVTVHKVTDHRKPPRLDEDKRSATVTGGQ